MIIPKAFNLELIVQKVVEYITAGLLSVEICGVLAQLELCSLKGRGSGIKVGCWVSSKRQWQAGRVQRVVRSQGWGH